MIAIFAYAILCGCVVLAVRHTVRRVAREMAAQMPVPRPGFPLAGGVEGARLAEAHTVLRSRRLGRTLPGVRA